MRCIAGAESPSFEDNSPPHDVKGIITAAHDQATAPGEEAPPRLAWWNCYKGSQIDVTVTIVANLLCAILQQRATRQDQTTFWNAFVTPARRVVMEQKRIALVEKHPNVADGHSSVCHSFFLGYLNSPVVYRQLPSMRGWFEY